VGVQTISRAYQYAIDTTNKNEQDFASHAGGGRYCYNTMLALVKAVMNQRAAERTYGIPEAQLTPSMNWSHYGLRRHWNSIKDETAPWWGQNSKEVYSDACSRLANGLSNFNKSRKGERAGKRVGFPKFHSKYDKDSVTFTTGTIRLEPDNRHITLPVVGTVKTYESTRKLSRHLYKGNASITKATLRRRGTRWFVSFTVEMQRHIPEQRDPETIVGVDVGLKTLYVGANPQGEQTLLVENMRPFAREENMIRRISHNLARKRRTEDYNSHAPSKRYQREQARHRKHETRARNRRIDTIHKTTTLLAKTSDVVVIEDLNVAGMMQYNRPLAKALQDAAFATFRTLLTYKCAWYGSTLIVADRFYPSSKTCSECGYVKTKLALSERMFTCEQCGISIDRDVNAARNLAKYGETCFTTGSRPVSGRGGMSKTNRTAVLEVSAIETSTLTLGDCPDTGGNLLNAPRAVL